MPVILGEASILTTPLSGVRIWALVTGCITFSLVASMDNSQAMGIEGVALFRAFCMSTWCLFFALSLLILLITYIQFHSLLPISWKNLTVTVATLATLMVFTATLAFPCLVLYGSSEYKSPRSIAVTVFSSLTFLAYVIETYLVRREQKGYMASIPGLLKVLQVFGGSVALLLFKYQVAQEKNDWKVLVPGLLYTLCLMASLGTVMVMVGDCAGRCPLPFDRVLAGLSLVGVLLYMVAAVVSSTKVLLHRAEQHSKQQPDDIIIISEMTFTCITLLSYTVDLAFSIKLLCDRN